MTTLSDAELRELCDEVLHPRKPLETFKVDVINIIASALLDHIDAIAQLKNERQILADENEMLEESNEQLVMENSRLTSESLPAKASVTEQTVLDEAVRTAATWPSDGERIQGTTSMSRYKSPPIEADKGVGT